MNKTLLLIICDFLLISILALVEFKTDELDPLVEEDQVIQNSAGELLELLQLSLEHENQQRQNIEATLAETTSTLAETTSTLEATSQELAERERSLAQTAHAKLQLEQLAAQLEQNLSQTRSSLEMTEEEKARVSAALQETQARSLQLQSDLQQEQQRAAQRAAELDAAEQALRSMEANQATLQTELRIRDTQTQMLQENLVAARAEVERARLEAEAAARRVENLTAGVSELAATSTAMQEEIRQAQPLSLNVIFQRFEDNRVRIRFDWTEQRLLGSLTRDTTIQSVLIQHNGQYFAIFSTENTPLDSSHSIRAAIQIGTRSFSINEVGRLRTHNRIASVQIPAEIVAASNLQPFILSPDPLRFTEAVLISDSQPVYGEIPVRIPSGEPGRLQIESRMLSRLFGEYSPRVGDYVFSKSGALIGIMIAPNRALIIDSLEPASFQRL